MPETQNAQNFMLKGIVRATGEAPMYNVGQAVKICERFPIGHYRVPIYVRGKRGTVESIILPVGVDNEEEGFGRNAGSKRHYYRIAIPLTELWANYAGSARDSFRIEVFETWLEGV